MNGSELTFTLGPLYNKFPDRVRLRRPSFISNALAQEELYFKRTYAHINIVMLDDENTIGTSECSNCKSSIDIFVKFCPCCGAKIKGKRIIENSEKKSVYYGASNESVIWEEIGHVDENATISVGTEAKDEKDI